MAGEKLSPRQQMINLMYLVLLVMLAMSASKDLLNAFIQLQDGIEVTNLNFKSKNEGLFQKFEQAAAQNPSKQKYLDQATLVAQSADELDSLIENQKKWLVDAAGGLDENGVPESKDNPDLGAELLIIRGKGKELREALNTYEEQLVKLLPESQKFVADRVKTLLATPPYVDAEGVEFPWEHGISEHMPLVAVTAHLSNIQTYVQNAASEVLGFLYQSIEADMFKFNKVFPVVLADKGSVLRGDKYQASVFVAAFDSTQQPEVYLGDYDEAAMERGELVWNNTPEKLDVEAGMGSISLAASRVGQGTVRGVIKMPHPNPSEKGRFFLYPFEQSYDVSAPSAVVSADKMNVMYEAIENPMSVSANGFKPNQLELKSTGVPVKVRKLGNGSYSCTPTRPGRVEMEVWGVENGQRKLLGKKKYRVKRLPDPRPYFATKTGAFKATPGTVKGFDKVTVKNGPDFLFQLKWKVESFKVEFIDRGTILPAKFNKGAEMTADVKKYVAQMSKRNSVMIIKDIRAIDPAGKSRPIKESIAVTIR